MQAGPPKVQEAPIAEAIFPITLLRMQVCDSVLWHAPQTVSDEKKISGESACLAHREGTLQSMSMFAAWMQAGAPKVQEAEGAQASQAILRIALLYFVVYAFVL